MNKTAIKKFAVESRQKLIKSTIERLEELGITDKEVVEVVELGGIYTIKAQTLTESQKKNRDTIIQKIQEKGYEPFVEEIAYTWFNRIIAIRYMEVNDYLPFRTRVLSSEVPGKVDPDIITEIADHIEELELNRDKVIELKEQNKQEELFKYVFIKVCNYLGQFLPVMFEQIEDYTELLLPSVMISNGSVIKDMIHLVPEENWTNQVEIIGWLYQYYISEKKDQVYADVKKNKKITKENIPAATQLFTPEWIVKYMVENSLGRLWLEGHPNEELKSKWKYYLEEAEQEENVKVELAKIKKESEILTPEDLTIIDPAMGSGHILAYAFDVLYQIYQSEGYSEKEIPRLILEKNIYGLDIDDRAGQLAYFALMMKARGYNRRFLKEIQKKHIQVNICSFKESNRLSEQDIDELSAGDDILKSELAYLVSLFNNVKYYGSLVDIKKINYNELLLRFSNRHKKIENLFNIDSKYKLIKNIIIQANILSKLYDICITNPPYMGISRMNQELSYYVKNNYPCSKSDLFSCFMEKGSRMIKKNGYNCMVTMQSWMFLGSFEKMRENIISTSIITNLMHMENMVMGIAFGTAVTVSRNLKIKNYKGTYNHIKLCDIKDNEPVEFPVKNNYLFNVSTEKFKQIPKTPFSYWLKDKTYTLFSECKKISDYGKPCKGIDTGDNDRFLRLWYEVDKNKVFFGTNNYQKAINATYDFYPYNKGGGYRKWYGNNEYVLFWGENGEIIKNFKKSNLRNKDFYRKSGLTWSTVTSNKFSLRMFTYGFYFDNGGCCLFIDNANYYLGLLNSEVHNYFQQLSPTLNFQPGDIGRIPVIIQSETQVNNLVSDCIDLSKKDWDSFEVSWDFKIHPLLKFIEKSGNYKISSIYYSWEFECEETFKKLKCNEEALNTIFINIYDLQDELTPEVEDKDITIRKADRDRDIKSFISYAVGCMMGRYSLDEEGLIYAGGAFDESKYQKFKADEDGILLISDTEYFEDDLLNRFVEFVKVVYGEETLEENLNFIADTECFKRKATESSRDCLRRYFLKGFMEDHLKVYQKRPIYWMFDSGKQNGFKALIYMHRYNEDMVAKVRTDYLHPLQRKYEAELERLDHLINFDNISAAEKGKAKKLQEQIHKQLDECTQYDLLLAHVAHQRIPLDLDDGVKVNYQKFQNIELTTDGLSKAKKGDLLYKVKM